MTQARVQSADPFPPRGPSRALPVVAVDAAAPGPHPDPEPRWVPSRFNARKKTRDGRLVLWNSLTESISVFAADAASAVEGLLSQTGFTGELRGLSRHLRDRGYIVAADLNEYRTLRLRHGQDHHRTDRLELILLPTEDCNLRCTYCYEEFPRGTMAPEVRRGVKKWLERRGKTLRSVSVGWFGGEPLYGWEAVADLAPHIQAFCRDRDIELSSHMTTNGCLLTKEKAQDLFRWGIREFQISLDGLAEVHDTRRIGRDGSPTFDLIMRNLSDLKDTCDPFRVTLRVNYDHENAPHVAPLLDVIESEFGGDSRFRMYFFPVEKWGGPNDVSLHVCGFKEGDRWQERLVDLALARDLEVGNGVLAHTVGAGVCYAARPYSFIVGASGKLMKCTVLMDKEEANVVGALTPDGEPIIDEDKLAVWTEPAFEDDRVCRSCHVLPTCQGMHCPMERLKTHKRFCMPVKRRLRHELQLTAKILDRRRQRREQQAAGSDAGDVS